MYATYLVEDWDIFVTLESGLPSGDAPDGIDLVSLDAWSSETREADDLLR